MIVGRVIKSCVCVCVRVCMVYIPFELNIRYFVCIFRRDSGNHRQRKRETFAITLPLPIKMQLVFQNICPYVINLYIHSSLL